MDSSPSRRDKPPAPTNQLHRVVRALIDRKAAALIGPSACNLITTIASEQAAKRSSAVVFADAWLMRQSGIATFGAFNRIRDAAAAAGWLHFRTSERPSVFYSTAIPPEGAA